MQFASCYPPVKQTDSTYFDQRRSNYRSPQYVKYVPVGFADTHSKAVGYLFWLIGFTGAHRFYYGRPLTGILWFFTFGLLGIGWLVDFFLIPTMDREADQRYSAGSVDYSLSWILLVFLGWAGLHRFYQARIFTGLLYFLTGGLFGIGILYDVLTMNEQISSQNERRQTALFTFQ